VKFPLALFRKDILRSGFGGIFLGAGKKAHRSRDPRRSIAPIGPCLSKSEMIVLVKEPNGRMKVWLDFRDRIMKGSQEMPRSSRKKKEKGNSQQKVWVGRGRGLNLTRQGSREGFTLDKFFSMGGTIPAGGGYFPGPLKFDQ
jgi:hypothetical protein